MTAPARSHPEIQPSLLVEGMGPVGFRSSAEAWTGAIVKNYLMRVVRPLLGFTRAALLRVLPFIKVFPTRLTDHSAVEGLLDRLHPVLTDKELIRLGPRGDGGYLVPDDLAGIEMLFSPGVDRISGFEKDCAELGMRVFMADKSVEQPADVHDLFHFTRKHLGAISDEETMTLDDWVSESSPGSSADLLLQIDIEGGEYEVLLATSAELLRRFRIIVAEFHQLDMLFSAPFFGLANTTFEKILQTHDCVHIHPNNCCGSLRVGELEVPRIAEFTFHRRDRLEQCGFATEFPHPLDVDNTSASHMKLSPSLFRHPGRELGDSSRGRRHRA
ncbi:MAG: FkbM family methyltransferase, partial [Ilumatobacteraceae bacterium]